MTNTITIKEISPALFSWTCSHCACESADYFIGRTSAESSAAKHEDRHKKGWIK